MKTYLLNIDNQGIEQIRSRERKVEVRRNIPNLQENDLLIFFTKSPFYAIQTYAFVDKLISGTPAQMWKKAETTVGMNKNEFFSQFENCELTYGIALKSVVNFKEAISLDRLLEIPDFYLPCDSGYIELTADIFCKYLNISLPTAPMELHYVYLAEDVKPKANEIANGSYSQTFPNIRLCFLGVSKRKELIEQNIRYYYPNLELIAYVAFFSVYDAMKYLNHLRKQYEENHLDGKWYELSLNESTEIIDSFQTEYQNNPIDFMLVGDDEIE